MGQRRCDGSRLEARNPFGSHAMPHGHPLNRATGATLSSQRPVVISDKWSSFGPERCRYTSTVLAPAHAATVLIVEDDSDLRRLYRQALIASRYDVKVAADGLSALRIVDRDCPDVIVLDL